MHIWDLVILNEGKLGKRGFHVIEKEAADLGLCYLKLRTKWLKGVLSKVCYALCAESCAKQMIISQVLVSTLHVIKLQQANYMQSKMMDNLKV